MRKHNCWLKPSPKGAQGSCGCTRRTIVRAILGAFATAGKPHLVSASAPSLADPAPENWQLHYDPLEMFKKILGIGLGLIPDVGSLVSGLVSLLWPDDDVDVWSAVRAQVESLVNRKIDNAVFSLLEAKLNGLGNVLKLYLQAVATGDPAQMRMQFVASNTEFVAAAESFKNSDYQFLIAPLCGMFASMHATLYRDCILNGKGWGWPTAVYESIIKQCAESLDSYTHHLQTISSEEKSSFDRNAPTSPGEHMTDIYNHYQPFLLTQTILVDDFLILIKYLDPVAYPGQTAELPFKDVYSLAYGTADDWDAACGGWCKEGVAALYSRPLAAFHEIYIEYFNFTPRVVDIRYPSGKGPIWKGGGRIDRYGIIADPKSGVERATIQIPPPGDGKKLNVSKVHLKSASIPIDVSLELDDGRIISLWERRDLYGPRFEVSVPGRMLSTFNMWSRSHFYDWDLGCVIFGFSVDSEFIPKTVKEHFYIGSVSPPNLGAPYLPQGVPPQLQQRRAKFWGNIASWQGSKRSSLTVK